MMGTVSLLLMVLAGFGGGAAVLRATCTLAAFTYCERLAVSFVLGIGVIGWCVFFLALAGHAGRAELIVLLVGLACGGVFLKPPAWLAGDAVRLDKWAGILIAAIAVMFFLDLLEGVAPPADGDSLAYHFALPKAFLGAGGLFPIFRAVEGTVPLLQQMTYMAALGVGGEQGMTLWAMVSGWGPAALLFVLARRYVAFNWALASALSFLCLPAVIYGAGNGQVEARNAGFVLVAALALIESRRGQVLRFTVLAGVAAGFFVASKYTGLIFAAAAGLVLIWHRRWLPHACIYGLAAAAAGGQWYAWNAWISGDPLFPLLFGWLPYRPEVPWNAAIHALYHEGLGHNPLDINLFWYLAYPFKATLFPHPAFESLRVGFGPLAMLLLPFSLLALWRHRDRIRAHPLTAIGWVCLITYTIWFFSGQSQKVRHFLPIYPLLLTCFLVAALRLAEDYRSLRRPLFCALAATLALQMGGAALFSINYARFALGGESRDAFLARNVPAVAVVPRLHELLGADARVLTTVRQLVYYLDVPVFYANPLLQAEIELHRDVADPEVLWRQLMRKKTTHMLVEADLDSDAEASGFVDMLRSLVDHGCLRLIEKTPVFAQRSRTLPSMDNRITQYSLLEIRAADCRYGDRNR